LNKIEKGDTLYKLEKFKNLISHISDKFYSENIKSINGITFEFPVEIPKNTNYSLNQLYLELDFNVINDDLKYLNKLFWIYISSDKKFIKQVTLFKKILKKYNRCIGDINPLYSIEYDEDFQKFLVKKLTKSSKGKIESFENYRDLFYDKFGIDIVEYYDKYLDPYPFRKKQEEAYKANLKRNTLMKFYPYKREQFQFNIEMAEPVHRFIKRFIVSIEISPFDTNKTINRLIKSIQILINSNITDLESLNKDYKKKEWDKYTYQETFKQISSGKDILKKAFLVFEIQQFFRKTFDESVRYYNFFLLKHYYDEIYLDESNLLEMLEVEDEFTNVQGSLTLSDNTALSFIFLQGDSYKHIKKSVEVLSKELVP